MVPKMGEIATQGHIAGRNGHVGGYAGKPGRSPVSKAAYLTRGLTLARMS